MASSRKVQIRHIVVAKEDVANLLKETIEAVSGEVPRVKMLMRLAEKYSLCKSKDEGGNLGWLDLNWEDFSPGSFSSPSQEYFTFDNHEFEAHLRAEGKRQALNKGVVYGPVETPQGRHIFMIAQENITHRL
ncbi:MAG: hypothetical protein G3M78_00530 [Candidatus Nitrohelix vancouverensis]|uniref:PpiC domain-containing protein n=1 Tax=Candidatus Nitrohelix vancouverensis TaxID=2705534 RepID=A0A7T0BZW4_9BACT|nr:MAG: hypothetical protein G3M78_00530 [Candidatus Nitrohelix vancouverensis]